MGQSSEAGGMGLRYADEIPCAIAYSDQPPLANTILREAVRNEDVLRTISALEEQSREPAEEGATNDLQRLEFKLNVVMDLLTSLISQQSQLPAPRSVSLGSDGLYWNSATPMSGSNVTFTLYLSSKYPRPVVLHAQVTEPPQALTGYNAYAQFLPLPEPLQGLFDKFIFRRHRRLVAYSRRGPGSAEK